jgi:translation initiation factor 2B subunit (eIF-2B alpha/beta/delta family)
VECARELGVATTVLATTDKLTPGGDLRLPDWASGEAWHLWESAPKDVEVEAQPFESVGLEWVDGVATEVGLMLPGDLQQAPLRTI